MQIKSLILFMPSIEGGGVEKNLLIISNYFVKKIKNIKLISAENRLQNFFNKKINFISPSHQFLKNKNRLFGKIGTYVMEKYQSFQIDNIEDFNIVESIIKNKKKFDLS